MDVLQAVEYVKQEAKMVYLLECLQKTPPPVIIFSENKNEVDGMLIYINVYVVLAYLYVQIFRSTCSSKVLRQSLFMVPRVCF